MIDITCKNCGKNLDVNSRFCSSCGNQISKNSEIGKELTISKIIWFYVVMIIFLITSVFTQEKLDYSIYSEITFEFIFILIVLLFSLSNYKEIIQLYRIPKKRYIQYTLAFLIPFVSSFSVSFFIDLVENLSDSLISTNMYADYASYKYSLSIAFVFIAVLPAIFEELAFRGYLYNLLKKISSEKTTIIATAFIFALVHFPFLSLIWIFPFGLILGYFRMKYKTLWFGMIIHFIHNLIVLLIDFYDYNQLS